MPDRSEYRTDPTKPTDVRRPRYLQGLLVVFVAPLVFFRKLFFQGIPARPLFLATFLVTLLGWAWSITLSYNQWWLFPKKFIVGVWVLPHLPIEEALFYPLGILFIIGFYNVLCRLWPGRLRGPGGYRIFVYAVTAVFAALAVIYRREGPYYMVSQLIVFNLVAIACAEKAWRRICPRPFAATTAFFTVVGFAWNYVAVKYDWWIYNATFPFRLFGTPVEDVNFYLFGTAAGLSLYLASWPAGDGKDDAPGRP